MKTNIILCAALTLLSNIAVAGGPGAFSCPSKTLIIAQVKGVAHLPFHDIPYVGSVQASCLSDGSNRVLVQEVAGGVKYLVNAASISDIVVTNLPNGKVNVSYQALDPNAYFPATLQLTLDPAEIEKTVCDKFIPSSSTPNPSDRACYVPAG